MAVQDKIKICLNLLVAVLLTSCATTIPKPIDEQIESIPELNVVRQNVDDYIGHRVRWGGVIANIINEKDATVLEIVDHPLSKQGRPTETDQTQGRFLARINGFLDPVIYAKRREITIVGTINKETKQLIYQFEYSYPEIVVDSLILWPQVDKQMQHYYEPYWYDPWYPRYFWSPYYYPYRYPHRH